VKLKVNGETREIDLPPDTPLLWALRDGLGLTGSKIGCGMALYGACTVHLDGAAVRACVTPPLSAVGEREVLTIEGLSADGSFAAAGTACVDFETVEFVAKLAALRAHTP